VRKAPAVTEVPRWLDLLFNKVWQRLADNAVLERSDLRESLAQMRRGDGIPTDIDELERDLGIAD
jgi:hypothetical protein